MSQELLQPEALARELGVTTQTLARWRVEGFGPSFVLVGRLVRYERAAIDRFIAERRMSSTSVPVSAMPSRIGS